MSEKQCPKCGSTTFMAIIERPGKVASVTDPETGEVTYEILEEGDKYNVRIRGCASCKTKLTEEDLVESTKCSKCGQEVMPSMLDSDGVCFSCKMKEEHPELVDKSHEELLALLYQAMNAKPERKRTRPEGAVRRGRPRKKPLDIQPEPEVVNTEALPAKEESKEQEEKVTTITNEPPKNDHIAIIKVTDPELQQNEEVEEVAVDAEDNGDPRFTIDENVNALQLELPDVSEDTEAPFPTDLSTLF